MKLFKLIGKLADHSESLVDSLATTAVTASDTLGVFATTAKLNAEVEQSASVAETKLEAKVRLMALQAEILVLQEGKTAESPVNEASVLDLISSLG